MFFAGVFAVAIEKTLDLRHFVQGGAYGEDTG